MEHYAYDLPDYYDWTSTGLDRDVTYYVDLAKASGGPVLELGCGTGRISLAIARAGIPVVGVDNSPAMLNRARQKAEQMELADKIEWIEADMARMELTGQFPLIIIPYRSFLHLLTVNDQVETLKRVRRYLTDDGLFAFNIFVPKLWDLIEKDSKLSYCGAFPVPGTQELIEVNDYTEFDHYRQTARVIRYMDRYDKEGRQLERVRAQFDLRYLFPTECFHLLTLCGFQIVNSYGTFHRSTFDEFSEELIIEAVKRKIGRDDRHG
ncbi:class I SAM-dependent methyltransferase [Laceyella tengchongensis]|jgi:ubiquinone/menaquinone biosynthesis C-methylase UbiE|uniref:class I SAM-dependent methyltransferase n=1 Tax=Laceyella tengchongensis TaxID=574699 RepID=UPI0003B739A0|nr:methylase [Thermoactinomyces vulgaris]MRG29485.1 methyltransferase domain-containing protein [Laceyella tengchongensis]